MWEKAFWNVVRKCLIQFHKLDGTQADAIQAAMEISSANDKALLYHNTRFYPFDFACDLAGQDMNFDECLNKYLLILIEEGVD